MALKEKKVVGYDWHEVGPDLLAGKTNLLALAIGAGTLLTILLLKRYPRLPSVLIAVVGATLVVTLQDLASTIGVHAGVPVLGAPRVKGGSIEDGGVGEVPARALARGPPGVHDDVVVSIHGGAS